MITEDKKVIQGFFNREETACATIYYQYFRLIKHVALGILNSDSLADDVVQETFLKALAKQETFKLGTNFTAWLCEIARNLAINKKKEESRYQPLDEEKLLNIPQEDSVEVSSLIDRIKASLSSDEFDIYFFRAYYQLSFKEIAEICHSQEDLVRSHYHRISKKVKEIFKE